MKLALVVALLSLFFVSLATQMQVEEPEPAPVPAPMDPEQAKIYGYVDLAIQIASIVLGVLWLFLGYRLIKVVLFLAGFVVFFFVVFALLAKYQTTLALWLCYIIAGAAGIICGALLVLLRKVGYFLMGFVMGAVVAAVIVGGTPLVSFFSSGLIPLIIILSTGLVVAIATVFLQKILLVIATAVSGAYMVGTTVDNLAFGTSVGKILINIITNFGSKIDPPSDWKPYVVLGGIVVLAIVGMIVQFLFTARGHEEEEKKTDEEGIPLLIQANI